MKQFRIIKSIPNKDDDLVNTYLKDIAKIPRITTDEEKELTIKIQNGDMLARDKLVSANLRFVVTVAKQYQNLGIPLIDLINIGNYGLIEASTRYTLDHNCKFISYAVWWIRQAITQALFSESRTIRLPVSQTSFVNKIEKATSDFEKENEREPSVQELAKILKTSVKRIKEVQSGIISCTSTDASVSDDEDSCTIGDLIPNKGIENSDELAERNDVNIEIKRLLNKFPPREQDILRMFYGLGGVQQLTYPEIGKRFGLTGERIRQITKDTLREIKNKYSNSLKELL